MMDKTNRIIKICRRIEQLEYILACNDRLPSEEQDIYDELSDLEEELDSLQPASAVLDTVHVK